jgi:hypothetical protein
MDELITSLARYRLAQKMAPDAWYVTFWRSHARVSVRIERTRRLIEERLREMERIGSRETLVYLH